MGPDADEGIEGGSEKGELRRRDEQDGDEAAARRERPERSLLLPGPLGRAEKAVILEVEEPGYEEEEEGEARQEDAEVIETMEAPSGCRIRG